jgi:hypothetical protein
LKYKENKVVGPGGIEVQGESGSWPPEELKYKKSQVVDLRRTKRVS